MSPYSKNIQKPLGKMKTILTEDSPGYDDDDFGGTRSQTKLTATGVHFIPAKNLANNSASNFANNSPKNFAGNFTNNSPSNSVANPLRNLTGNLAGSQATNSQNAIEATLLTGMLKEVLTGDKTRQSIADNKLAKENQQAQEAEAAHQRAQAQAQTGAQIGAQATPKRVMSKEEEWYPVTYAQKQKEKEEAEWVANNPNATAAELFYPSMRKTVSPVIPTETQPANSPASKVVSGFTRVANAGEMGQGAENRKRESEIPSVTLPIRNKRDNNQLSLNLPLSNIKNDGNPIPSESISPKTISKEETAAQKEPVQKVTVQNAGQVIAPVTLPLTDGKIQGGSDTTNSSKDGDGWLNRFREYQLENIDLVEFEDGEYEYYRDQYPDNFMIGLKSGTAARLLGIKAPDVPVNMTQQEILAMQVGQAMSDSPKTAITALATARGGRTAGVLAGGATEMGDEILRQLVEGEDVNFKEGAGVGMDNIKESLSKDLVINSSTIKSLINIIPKPYQDRFQALLEEGVEVTFPVVFETMNQYYSDPESVDFKKIIENLRKSLLNQGLGKAIDKVVK